MLQKIFSHIAIFFLLFSKALANDLEPVAAIKSDNKTQSAEEISADLIARKKAEEPFDPKDIKVDIHSLGLDDVDNKSSQNATKIIEEKNSDDAQGKTKIISKIKNLVNKIKPDDEVKNQDQSQSAAIENIAKDSDEKYLKLSSKQKLRKRIAAEKKKAKTLREKKRLEAKEARLNALREKYLLKLDQEKSQKIAEENYDENEIIPREKNLAWSQRFLTYDIPPAPILDRYRGNDNKHIPIIPTAFEKIDLLFQIISNNSDGDPAAFHSAYQYILDPDIANEKGETILTYATLLQKYSIMTSILGKGADPDLPNVLGHTALDIAIEMLDLKSCNILLDMNANINYVDGFGRTYLMHATRVGFLPIVDLLVTRGADINAVDNEGRSALNIAYAYKKDVIVKYLLKHNAKISAPKAKIIEEKSIIKELENKWRGDMP